MKYILILILFLTNAVILEAQIPEEHKELSLKLETQFASKIDSTIKLSRKCVLTYSSDSTFKCLHLTLKNRDIILLNIRLITDNQKLPELVSDNKKFFSINIISDLRIIANKVSKKDGSKERYFSGSVSW